MQSDIYRKLFNMRAAIQKEEIATYEGLIEFVHKKAKYYRILPRYCFYGDVATLSILDLDNTATCLKFQIPVNLVSIKNAKQYLYKMAFDIEDARPITIKHYKLLTEKMAALKVKEKDILDRYHIKALEDMTEDVYERCMSVFRQMSN